MVVDTTRADRLSCEGYSRPTTPRIDRLAREGAVYLKAWSPAPWTLPAHASLFTGLYPSTHGADSGHLTLDDTLPFLARRFHDAGYRTQAYVENPWVGKEYHFDAGFDTFDEVWRGVRSTEGEGDMGAAAVAAKVGAWLGWRDATPDAKGRPFFLFINYFEPHLPYNPPRPERDRFLRPGADPALVERLRRYKHPEEMRQILGLGGLGAADFAVLSDLYDGEIAYVDRRLGEVIDVLQERGLLDRTVVAIASDHGEMLGEHGLVDHKIGLYEPVLRIPLVLRYPPRVAAGQRIDSPVMLQDLYPTLLGLAGLAEGGPAAGRREAADGGPGAPPDRMPAGPEARPLPGVAGLHPGAARGARLDDPIVSEEARPADFLDVLRETVPGVDPAPFDRTLVALHAGEIKMIWASDGRHRLFDLARDPGETADLAAQEGAGAAPYAGAAERWLRRPGVRPLFAAALPPHASR